MLKSLRRTASCLCMPLVFAATLAVANAQSAAQAAATSKDGAAAARFPGAQWSHGDPVAMGWSMKGLAAVAAFAQQVGSTSLMIVQHGVVVDEWGDTQAQTPLYSVRKSFASALIGIAVARHQIDPDATLEQLGIDDNAPSLTPVEKQATVRELLEARSGVYHATVYETAAMRDSKPERGSHAPGEFWYYNNWDFNTVGAIYEKAVGMSLFDALDREIAQPIGMQDFHPSAGRYVRGEPATRYPAYTMRMSARDLARFAWLFLNEGRWNGQQIVPADWVAQSTRPASDTQHGGYADMWWTSLPASDTGKTATSDAGDNYYWADGHRGQFAIVVPALDLVIVNRVDPRLSSKHISQQARAKLVELVEKAATESAEGHD